MPKAVLEPDQHIYPEARNALQDVCEAYRLEYITIYSVDPQASTRTIYLCVTPDEEKNDALQRDYVQKALPVVELMRGEERILAGSREIQQEVGRTPNGAMYTWLSPYLDSEGKLRPSSV